MRLLTNTSAMYTIIRHICSGCIVVAKDEDKVAVEVVADDDNLLTYPCNNAQIYRF